MKTLEPSLLFAQIDKVSVCGDGVVLGGVCLRFYLLTKDIKQQLVQTLNIPCLILVLVGRVVTLNSRFNLLNFVHNFYRTLTLLTKNVCWLFIKEKLFF